MASVSSLYRAPPALQVKEYILPVAAHIQPAWACKSWRVQCARSTAEHSTAQHRLRPTHSDCKDTQGGSKPLAQGRRPLTGRHCPEQTSWSGTAAPQGRHRPPRAPQHAPAGMRDTAQHSTAQRRLVRSTASHSFCMRQLAPFQATGAHLLLRDGGPSRAPSSSSGFTACASSSSSSSA